MAKIDTNHPAFPQPTHVCVGIDGSYFCRRTISELIDMGCSIDPHATVQLRTGETMEDAAWRHTQAEQRYWASL